MGFLRLWLGWDDWTGVGGPRGPETTAHLLSDPAARPLFCLRAARDQGGVLRTCLQLTSLGKGCFCLFPDGTTEVVHRNQGLWLPAEGGHWGSNLDIDPRKQPQPLGPGLRETRQESLKPCLPTLPQFSLSGLSLRRALRKGSPPGAGAVLN